MLGLTPDLEDAIVDAASRGVPPSTAAIAAGIEPRTVRQWTLAGQTGQWSDGTPVSPEGLQRLSAFSARLAAAVAQCEAERVIRIGNAGTYVAKSGIPEWRADAWLLNNHPAYRKTYREHRELKVETSGQVNHYHRQVSALDDAQLVEQLPDDLLDLLPQRMLALPESTTAVTPEVPE